MARGLDQQSKSGDRQRARGGTPRLLWLCYHSEDPCSLWRTVVRKEMRWSQSCPVGRFGPAPPEEYQQAFWSPRGTATTALLWNQRPL